MPLVRITAPDSLDRDQLASVAHGIHRALIDTIGIPEGDRFQLLITHTPEVFAFDPDYLDVARERVVCIEITLVGGRTDDTKRNLYRHIADNIKDSGVRSQDVFIVLTENHRADWSVGEGRAQLLDMAVK